MKFLISLLVAEGLLLSVQCLSLNTGKVVKDIGENVDQVFLEAANVVSSGAHDAVNSAIDGGTNTASGALSGGQTAAEAAVSGNLSGFINGGEVLADRVSKGAKEAGTGGVSSATKAADSGRTVLDNENEGAAAPLQSTVIDLTYDVGMGSGAFATGFDAVYAVDDAGFDTFAEYMEKLFALNNGNEATDVGKDVVQVTRKAADGVSSGLSSGAHDIVNSAKDEGTTAVYGTLSGVEAAGNPGVVDHDEASADSAVKGARTAGTGSVSGEQKSADPDDLSGSTAAPEHSKVIDLALDVGGGAFDALDAGFDNLRGVAKFLDKVFAARNLGKDVVQVSRKAADGVSSGLSSEADDAVNSAKDGGANTASGALSVGQASTKAAVSGNLPGVVNGGKVLADSAVKEARKAVTGGVGGTQKPDNGIDTVREFAKLLEQVLALNTGKAVKDLGDDIVQEPRKGADGVSSTAHDAVNSTVGGGATTVPGAQSGCQAAGKADLSGNPAGVLNDSKASDDSALKGARTTGTAGANGVHKSDAGFGTVKGFAKLLEKVFGRGNYGGVTKGYGNIPFGGAHRRRRLYPGVSSYGGGPQGYGSIKFGGGSLGSLYLGGSNYGGIAQGYGSIPFGGGNPGNLYPGGGNYGGDIQGYGSIPLGGGNPGVLYLGGGNYGGSLQAYGSIPFGGGTPSIVYPGVDNHGVIYPGSENPGFIYPGGGNPVPRYLTYGPM